MTSHNFVWLHRIFFGNINFVRPHILEIFFFSKLISHMFVCAWSVIWLKMSTKLCEKAKFCVTEHNFARPHIIFCGRIILCVIVTEYLNFQNIFIQVLNNDTPAKKKIVHFNNSPFMTKTLKKAIMR